MPYTAYTKIGIKAATSVTVRQLYIQGLVPAASIILIKRFTLLSFWIYYIFIRRYYIKGFLLYKTS
jgi:hypothetical protein